MFEVAVTVVEVDGNFDDQSFLVYDQSFPLYSLFQSQYQYQYLLTQNHTMDLGMVVTMVDQVITMVEVMDEEDGDTMEAMVIMEEVMAVMEEDIVEDIVEAMVDDIVEDMVEDIVEDIPMVITEGSTTEGMEAIAQISMATKSQQDLILRKGTINKYKIMYNIINLYIPINFF